MDNRILYLFFAQAISCIAAQDGGTTVTVTVTTDANVVTTEDAYTDTPPSPVDFSEDKSETKHNRLGVTWTETSNNSVTEYEITVHGPKTPSGPETLNKTETSYIREDLKPASKYTVTLVAVYDDASSYEVSVTITTLKDPNANNGSPCTYVSYKQICGWMAVFLCLYGSLLEG